jgi:type IV secretory pathway VirB4 component
MDGQALYYGMNALSHNVIMADRKKLKSANGLYLGSTGSGKSFAAKRELINVFLATNDRIVVVDPMGEYAPLVKRLGGQVIEIAPDSPNYINPMDIQMGINDEDSPLSMKADFLLSLCELIVGGKEGLQPIEKTVIDRCVRLVYRELPLGIGIGDMPLLQDLYEELLRQPEPEAKRVATALELYCTGSLNLFNHHTNVQTDARVVCIVLKNMGENLRKIAMHITNEFVTSAVNTNHAKGLSTWGYFDEFHILLRDSLTASYFVAVWKMLRKKGCVPSALTQNVKDLLASREIEAILDNTDFMILLSQAQSDRAILAKQLGIPEHQLSYITHSNSGEGLLFYGSVTIPFVDRFPKGEIYNLLTTRPEDVAHE